MSAYSYSGGCICGRIRYEIAASVSNLFFCHCSDCRRAVGSPAVPWGTVALDNFKVTAGNLALFRSSPKVERGFCSACGTSLTYRHEGRAGEIDFTLASLDDPSALKPERHIWLQDEVAWVKTADALPRFEKTMGSSG